jgi:hypothetical protein
MSPVMYDLGFNIPEDDILHGHRHRSRTTALSSAQNLTEMNTSIIHGGGGAKFGRSEILGSLPSSVSRFSRQRRITNIS